ncbi:TPA: protease FtsH-inhibitory lysogeny factor CIII [Escherichia coli]|nr:protease FtsH-inhibitory lysogeny factor CIII [Escherichia coli]
MPVFWRFQATVEEDGIFQLNESLLERITRKLRDGWKRVEVLLCAMK